MHLVLIAMVAMGTAVGLAHSLYGANSLEKWATYSLLAATWPLAFAAGLQLAACPMATQTRVLTVLLLGDLAMLIPRVATLGMAVRSPWGTSALLPFACASMLLSPSRRTAVVSAAAAAIAVLSAATSGMRSCVIVALAGVALTWGYLLLRVTPTRYLRRAASSGVLFALALTAALSYPAVRGAIAVHVGTVVRRVEATLLNEDKRSLDEGSRGREREAKEALSHADTLHAPLAMLVGHGHGFTYFNSKSNATVAHIHITPVAFFLRYGALGLILYALLAGSLVRSAAATLAQPPTASTGLQWGLQSSALGFLSLSLVAGEAMDPMTWVVLGNAIGTRTSASHSKAEQGAVSHRLRYCDAPISNNT